VAVVGVDQRGNRLLSSLSRADYALLEAGLEPADLAFRQCLEAPNKPIKTVYFPYRGIVSVVASSATRDDQAEVGLIGCEGMTGLSILLGTDRSPNEVYVQVAGDGASIASRDLLQAIEKSPSLRTRLLRYVQAFAIQASQTALSNARGKLEQRLARWLLMANDRIGGTQLSLTHEFLSLMLGVRRAGVTGALQMLEAQKIITGSRGHITILDRLGLERAAAGFYGVAERELERLLGRIA
jgi:CRP-like cAMP-binding protein